MSDNFPQGYIDARNKCPKNLLIFFDKKLEHHADFDLQPSATPQGQLYLFASIALLGLPQLFMISSNWSNYDIRHDLYKNLVQITQDEQRMELGKKPNCIHALEVATLHFTDLAHCPLKMLNILLLPDFQDYLKNDLKQLEVKRHDVEAKIQSSVLESETVKLEHQKDNLLSVMHKLRNAQYSKVMMQEIINKVRGNDLNKQWQDIFSTQIVLLKVHHQKIKQNTPQSKKIFSTIDTLITQLSIANDEYLRQYNLAQSPKDKLIAAQQLLDSCTPAIQLAKRHLNKEEHYTLYSLLADILNTLVLIATGGLSYFTTERFRLFSFQNNNKRIASTIVNNAEQKIDRAQVEISDLYEREAAITLS